MKATLQFELPEEGYEYMRAVHGSDYACIIDNILSTIRNKLKYDDKITEQEAEIYESIRDMIVQEISEFKDQYIA